MGASARVTIERVSERESEREWERVREGRERRGGCNSKQVVNIILTKLLDSFRSFAGKNRSHGNFSRTPRSSGWRPRTSLDRHRGRKNRRRPQVPGRPRRFEKTRFKREISYERKFFQSSDSFWEFFYPISVSSERFFEQAAVRSWVRFRPIFRFATATECLFWLSSCCQSFALSRWGLCR